MSRVQSGEGWAAAALDDLGSGPGFRKIRRELGVTAFGVNALVLPAGYQTGWHYHDQQEETYFVHQGDLQIDFGDGSAARLEAGGIARVDPSTHRRLTNVGSSDAVVVVFGGKDGYVGRDGRLPEGETSRYGAGGPPG